MRFTLETNSSSTLPDPLNPGGLMEPRLTAVAAYLKTKQLLLFVLEQQSKLSRNLFYHLFNQL